MRGEAILANNNRSDALSDGRHQLWVIVHDQVQMAVRIDKPGRDNLTPGIYNVFIRLGRDVADFSNRVTHQPNRACVSGTPRAIDDGSIDNDDAVYGGMLRRLNRKFVSCKSLCNASCRSLCNASCKNSNRNG